MQTKPYGSDVTQKKMNIRAARSEESYVNRMNSTAFVSSVPVPPREIPTQPFFLHAPCTTWLPAAPVLLFAERRGKSALFIPLDSHSLLLNKLARYRLEGWSARWVRNWLTDCTRRVVISGFYSGWQPVTGSIDSPSD